MPQGCKPLVVGVPKQYRLSAPKLAWCLLGMGCVSRVSEYIAFCGTNMLCVFFSNISVREWTSVQWGTKLTVSKSPNNPHFRDVGVRYIWLFSRVKGEGCYMSIVNCLKISLSLFYLPHHCSDASYKLIHTHRHNENKLYFTCPLILKKCILN